MTTTATSKIHGNMSCLLFCARGRTAGRRPPRGSQFRSAGRRGVFARLRLVVLQYLAMHVAAVETGDGGAGLVGVGELDEAEALRFTAGTLGGHIRRNELAVRHGEVVQLRIGDLLGEIAYIQFHL